MTVTNYNTISFLSYFLDKCLFQTQDESLQLSQIPTANKVKFRLLKHSQHLLLSSLTGMTNLKIKWTLKVWLKLLLKLSPFSPFLLKIEIVPGKLESTWNKMAGCRWRSSVISPSETGKNDKQCVSRDPLPPFSLLLLLGGVLCVCPSCRAKGSFPLT